MARMIESDELIYRRYLAEHNDDDFRVLVERHKESLMLFLYNFVHNMEDAEELMLDAYAEAAAGAGYSGKSTFRTWLFSIGKNMALMCLRKQRFTAQLPLEQTDETAAPPELDLLREEQNRQLYEALSRLREDYRQILILLYFEDMSYEEAGRVMGKNRKQAYNLSERGRAALREQLERMGFDDAQYG